MLRLLMLRLLLILNLSLLFSAGSAIGQSKSNPGDLSVPTCGKRPIGYGTATGTALWTYLMNRQPRNVCQEPYYLGAHRGAHTQDAQFNPIPGTGASGVDNNNAGNLIRWGASAPYPNIYASFIVDENTDLSFDQLVSQVGVGNTSAPGVSIIELDPRETADIPFKLILNHDPFLNRMVLPGGTTTMPSGSAWPRPIAVSKSLACQLTGTGSCGTQQGPVPINWGRNGQPAFSSYNGSNALITMEQGLQDLVKYPNLVAQIHVRNEPDIVRIVTNALTLKVADRIYFDMQGRDFCTATKTNVVQDSLKCVIDIENFKNQLDSELSAALHLTQSQLPKVGIMLNIYSNTADQKMKGYVGWQARLKLISVFGEAGSTQAAAMTGLQFMGVDLTNTRERSNANMQRWGRWMKIHGFNVAKTLWYPALSGMGDQTVTLLDGTQRKTYDLNACHINETGFPQDLTKVYCVDHKLSSIVAKRARSLLYALGAHGGRYKQSSDQVPADIVITDDPIGSSGDAQLLSNNNPVKNFNLLEAVINPQHYPSNTLDSGSLSVQPTVCATEGGSCVFNGAATVSFTAGNAEVTTHAFNDFPCTLNAFVTDPAPGVVKTCTYTLDDVGVPEGSYELTNSTAGLVLDMAGAATGQGGIAQGWALNGTGAQQWQITRAGNGYYIIENVYSGLVLANSGSNNYGPAVTQQVFDNDPGQWWGFTPQAGQYLITNVQSGLQLSVPNGNTSAGTPIVQANLNQMWILQETDDHRHSQDVTEEDDPQQPTFVGANYNLMSPKEGNYRIINRQTGYSLDLIYASNVAGQQIQQNPINQTSAQQWTITEVDDGIFTVANGGSGMVLDSSGGGSGSAVVQNPYSGSSGQMWKVTPYTDGGYTLTNLSNGLPLGVNLANNRTAQGGSDTSWILQSYQSALPNGNYQIVNLYSGQSMAVPGTTCTDNTNLVQYSPGNSASLWKVMNVGNGYYTIVNAQCNTALDSGGQVNTGSPAVEWASSGNSHQLWRISEDGEGSFSIINQSNALAISVGSANTSGSPVLQNTWTQTTDQSWFMIPQ